MDEVIARAREVVEYPPPPQGYSDVGDVLVRYLRGQIRSDEALEELRCLQLDYARARTWG